MLELGAEEVVEVLEAGQKVREGKVVSLRIRRDERTAKVARLWGFSTIAGSSARLAGNLGQD